MQTSLRSLTQPPTRQVEPLSASDSGAPIASSASLPLTLREDGAPYHTEQAALSPDVLRLLDVLVRVEQRRHRQATLDGTLNAGQR